MAKTAYCTNMASPANGTDTPKAVILEMHSIATMRENKAMYDALCEGTLGRAFRAFHATDPKAAMRVIESSFVWWRVSLYNPSYRAERGIRDMPGDLVGIGAFAHSFTEIVAQMAEPYIPLMVNHLGHVAWQRDAWEWFAQNVATGRK